MKRKKAVFFLYKAFISISDSFACHYFSKVGIRIKNMYILRFSLLLISV